MKPRIHQQHIGLMTVGAVLAGTSLTHAILNGTLDGNLHPNTGVVVAEVNGSRFAPCSGILVAPTVFVTAAHCLEFIQARGATQVFVTFDSEASVNTPTLISGTMHPNPAFDANAPDSNDVAVITLDTPVAGITPAVLPTPGLLDELGRQNGLKDQLFTVVGYGANQRNVGGGPPVFTRDLNRRFATSGLNALLDAMLHLSMNTNKGYGGASFGDSGGPIFLGQSTTVVAIVGLRGTEGMYEASRLDIPSARVFLANFVTLPN